MSKPKQKTATKYTANAAELREKLQAALRSIMRDWQNLSKPLPVDRADDEDERRLPNQVRGAQSYEELQEEILQFAGRVWQFKDGLWKLLESYPQIEIEFGGPDGVMTRHTGGVGAENLVEEYAKLCIPLLLCADLYNTHKHYENCNRSKYQPYLGGVSFQPIGVIGIRYDGARKSGELRVANNTPVPFSINVLSRTQPVDFGDGVKVVGQAFSHWIKLVRGLELLSMSNAVEKAILEDLEKVETEIVNISKSEKEAGAIDIGKLTRGQQRLVHTDPAKFVESIKDALPAPPA